MFIKNLQPSTNNLQPNLWFTLLEVLVSATLIAILSTLGFSSFQAITRSCRDALRKSELEQIRSALEIYKSENNAYPAAGTSCIPDLSASYLNPYPSDPKSPFAYCYVPGASNKTYTLCAHLENGDTSDSCGAALNCISPLGTAG